VAGDMGCGAEVVAVPKELDTGEENMFGEDEVVEELLGNMLLPEVFDMTLTGTFEKLE